MKKREKYLDILKVIGLLCIILAHVNPPSIVFQIRNFDVVLMILISAYLGLKYKKSDGYTYLKKRFKRLIFPTWTFLIIFFIIVLITNIFDISIKNIIGSFALSNYGTGYVWVIRIYFIIAILVLLYNYLKSIISEKTIVIVSSIIIVIHEILCEIGIFDNNILQYLFAYFAPCFLLLVISKSMFDNNKKNTIIILLSFIIFILFGGYLYAINGRFVSTQKFKYPFRIYYLSYGIFFTGILIKILKNTYLSELMYNKVIEFISSHSLWIYLWHILIIYMLKSIEIVWYFKFIIIILSALLIVFLQSKIIDRLEGKVNEKVLKIFIG